MQAGVLLHAALADEGLVTILTLELFGDVVEGAVHLEAVLVGEGLAAHLARVRPHARVVQHVDAQRVELGQRLAADVAHKLALGVGPRRLGVLAAVGEVRGGGGGRRRRLGGGRPLDALLLVAGQVGAQGGGVLEVFAAQLEHTERVYLEIFV